MKQPCRTLAYDFPIPTQTKLPASNLFLRSGNPIRPGTCPSFEATAPMGFRVRCLDLNNILHYQPPNTGVKVGMLEV